MRQSVYFTDLGSNRSYKEIWDLQEQLLQENVQKKIVNRSQPVDSNYSGINQPFNESPAASTVNHLLFVEHNPVYTLGKSGNINNVLISEEERERKGIEFFKINRGGDITFHGPEQLVGYPIFDLENFKTDVGWYLRSLEEVFIETLAGYGLKAGRSPGETGVWLDPYVKGKERKICAMGIRCSRWITMHGFAFNVNTDLTYFDYIIPCGIQNKQVTSLEKELGTKFHMDEVKERVKANFEKVFDIEIKAEKS